MTAQSNSGLSAARAFTPMAIRIRAASNGTNRPRKGA